MFLLPLNSWLPEVIRVQSLLQRVTTGSDSISFPGGSWGEYFAEAFLHLP